MAVLRRSPIARQWASEHGMGTPDEIERQIAAERVHGDAQRRRDYRDAQARAGVESFQTKGFLKRFIAWDGEGVTCCKHCEGPIMWIDKLPKHAVKGGKCRKLKTKADIEHRYVIFACGDKDGEVSESIVNPKGIPTDECFELMLRVSERDPKAIHVIFAGNYDTNMMLRPSMTRGRATRLAKLGKCTMKLNGKTYGVDYQPRHLLNVRELYWDTVKDQYVKVRGIMLWDVFGSYQSSFVKACRARLDPDDLTEIEEIERMKHRRSGFTLDDIPEMLTYCRRELTALAKLALVDAEDSEAAGIVGQRRWDGAGAKASILLSSHRIKDHKAETPDGILSPVRTAYAGGRIETFRFGSYTGPVFTVDIRSAYPWAATMLPSLRDGQWNEVEADGQSSDFSLIHLKYHAERLDTLHPFHWRGEKGGIAYPAMTEGWYWAPEVKTALACGVQGIELIEALDFTPANDDKPFGFIPDAFRARKLLDKQRKGRGQPLKLALNSVYGKLAQQLGSRDGKPPVWHQLEWAGWITSRCRAEMFGLAYPRKDRLVTIETDGISFLGVPDQEIIDNSGPALGDYEVETYAGGVWVQSGIYWLLDHDGWWKPPKVRGIGTNADGTSVLDRRLFVNAWEQKAFNVAVPVTVNRFRGMVTSALTPDRWDDWCKWLDDDREIAVAPRGKRVHMSCTSACKDGLHGTLPTGGGSMSLPHKLAWLNKLGPMFEGDEWWMNEKAEDDDEA